MGVRRPWLEKMTRVFNAFPNEEDRIPVLSFRHHQIAAATADPQKWLAEAVDNQWSTRTLQENINATKGDDTSKKDKIWDKAEKSLLLMQEVLETKEEAADWLLEEIEKLLSEKTKLSA